MAIQLAPIMWTVHHSKADHRTEKMLSTFSLDPRTAILLATLMMLLNGGVLGLMHRELAEDVRPSAMNWRVGTLLQATACVLLAVQNALPLGFVLPLANAALLLGLLAYLRAVCLFSNQRLSTAFLWPVIIAVFSVYWFAIVDPNLGIRLVIVSTAMAILLIASARYLHLYTKREASVSRSVLGFIFLLIGLFMLFRALYFLFVPTTTGTMLDRTSWVNAVTPLVVAILPVIGTTAYLLMCSDRLRRQWELAASTDYLTGLANRRTLAHAGERAFHSAQRQKQELSVAVIDVDHFKGVNDRYGHDTGDLALKHIARMLENAGRKNDFLGRQGGEEFVVLFDQTDREHGIVAAERLRTCVQDNVLNVGGHSVPMTVSVGLAVYCESDRNFNDLLRRADQALYAAKKGGRNRVEVADNIAVDEV
ncbi:MAG: GGDEF domain-containing protein [Arenimonas sp.]